MQGSFFTSPLGPIGPVPAAQNIKQSIASNIDAFGSLNDPNFATDAPAGGLIGGDQFGTTESPNVCTSEDTIFGFKKKWVIFLLLLLGLIMLFAWYQKKKMKKKKSALAFAEKREKAEMKPKELKTQTPTPKPQPRQAPPRAQLKPSTHTPPKAPKIIRRAQPRQMPKKPSPTVLQNIRANQKRRITAGRERAVTETAVCPEYLIKIFHFHKRNNKK